VYVAVIAPQVLMLKVYVNLIQKIRFCIETYQFDATPKFIL